MRESRTLRDFGFIEPDARVYAVRAACENEPVRACIVESVHGDESYAELHDDYIGDVTADFEDIYETKAEAEAAARGAGLL